jgi:mannose-6-phosphate isomerase-like protein (cupin superfamily)
MPVPPTRVLIPGGGRPFVLPTGAVGIVKLAGPDTAGTLSAFELEVEPGTGPGLHVHGREDELWYVLAGEFRFQLGDELDRVSAGGLAFGPRGTPHTFQNIGAATGRLLVITTPSGLEDFFLEYDRLATGPDDTSALAAAARAGGIDFVGPPLPAPAPPV